MAKYMIFSLITLRLSQILTGQVQKNSGLKEN